MCGQVRPPESMFSCGRVLQGVTVLFAPDTRPAALVAAHVAMMRNQRRQRIRRPRRIENSQYPRNRAIGAHYTQNHARDCSSNGYQGNKQCIHDKKPWIRTDFPPTLSLYPRLTSISVYN